MNSKAIFFPSVMAWMLLLSPAWAQIKSDGTTGTAVNKTDTRFQIEGGTTRGSTLFHSFEQFNVPRLNQAYFTNPTGISLILSRVTGKGISNINGTLGVDGGADLFLLNPNGITFGPNASLDLNGSFLATTASEFVFEDGKTFSASNPGTVPNLTVSVPLGVQFGKKVENIQVRTTGNLIYDPSSLQILQCDCGLSVQPGNTISLLGGDLSFQGGSIYAPNGNIELGSVDVDSFVDLTSVSKGWSLGYSQVENYKDISLSNGHVYNFNFDQQSSNGIRINSKEVILNNSSSIYSFAFNNGIGGKILINADESVNISNGGAVLSLSGDYIYPDGRLIDDHSIGGDIEINTGSLSVSNSGWIYTDSVNHSTGGNINIWSKNLSLTSGGNIKTAAMDYENGGDINIYASDSTLVSGQYSGIFVISYSTGKTGNLSLISKEIDISNGAEIGVFGNGNGPTGSLDIYGNNLTLNNADISVKGINSQLGDLNIGIDNLLLLQNESNITYEAEGFAIGDEVNISAPMIVAFPDENSDIVIDAPRVQTSIDGQVLGLRRSSEPTSMSEIIVDSDDDRELVGEYGRTSRFKISEYSEIPVQPQKIVQGCRPGQALGNGHFVYKGKGGLPPNPYKSPAMPAVWQDLRLHHLQSNSINKPLNLSLRISRKAKAEEKNPPQSKLTTKAQEITEAKGWVKDKNGRIILTSSPNKSFVAATYQLDGAC